MIQWPDDLIMDIARRTCVLYIGAGISANSEAPDGSKPPTWKEFLSKALKNVKKDKDFIQQLLDENDMLTACEIIMEKLGTHEFHNIAHDCFRRPGYKPAEIHEVIYNCLLYTSTVQVDISVQFYGYRGCQTARIHFLCNPSQFSRCID